MAMDFRGEVPENHIFWSEIGWGLSVWRTGWHTPTKILEKYQLRPHRGHTAGKENCLLHEYSHV